MKSPFTLRPTLLAAAAAFALVTAGCASPHYSNGGGIAGSTGPDNEAPSTPSSGVGPGGHAPATNETHVAPTNAGPAGSR